MFCVSIVRTKHKFKTLFPSHGNCMEVSGIFLYMCINSRDLWATQPGHPWSIGRGDSKAEDKEVPHQAQSGEKDLGVGDLLSIENYMNSCLCVARYCGCTMAGGTVCSGPSSRVKERPDTSDHKHHPWRTSTERNLFGQNVPL